METHLSTSSLYIVVESARRSKAPCPTQRETRSDDLGKISGVDISEVAPVIGSWIEACFPGSSPASKAGIEELIAEAADAARNDFGVDAANEWAEGYTFPPEFVASDIRCLCGCCRGLGLWTQKLEDGGRRTGRRKDA